jgi:ribose/xylose/arabinose/galactoside ABC-type transport system permease subunit
MESDQASQMPLKQKIESSVWARFLGRRPSVVAPISLSASVKKTILSEYFVLYLSIFYLIVLGPFVPGLFGAQNITDVLSNMWPLLIIAIGQTFVLITAGIDLSQTSVMALTSVIGAMLMATHPDPILFSKSPLWHVILFENGGLFAGYPFAVGGAIVVMLAIGAAVGLFNGIAVALFRMPAFIVTLVSMMFFSAVAIYLPKSENIRGLPDTFTGIASGSLGFLSYPFLLAICVAVIAHLLLSKTLYGRRLYAIGINPTASAISGIPTARIIVCAYVISALCATLGGILYSSRLEMGRPTLGAMQFIDIVGANVIAGVSLAGGKGKVTWTFFGVFFFVLLANTLNLLNLPFYMIDIVKGLVILAAALLDVMRNRAALQSR